MQRQSDVHSLKIQVDNRICNLKRIFSSSRDTGNDTSKKLKRPKLATTTNCNPKNDLVKDELNEANTKLLEVYKDQASADKNSQLIQKRFSTIKKIMNSEPYTINQSKLYWPLFFKFDGLSLHYRLLMRKSLDEVMKPIATSRSRIIAFMQLHVMGGFWTL